jgi:hypothetical protein
MIQYISLKVEDKDMPKVIDFTQRLGIEIVGKTIPDIKNEAAMREWAMNYFSDNPSFGDASEWQREERKDRKLPYRD